MSTALAAPSNLLFVPKWLVDQQNEHRSVQKEWTDMLYPAVTWTLLLHSYKGHIPYLKCWNLGRVKLTEAIKIYLQWHRHTCSVCTENCGHRHTLFVWLPPSRQGSGSCSSFTYLNKNKFLYSAFHSKVSKVSIPITYVPTLPPVR